MTEKIKIPKRVVRKVKKSGLVKLKPRVISERPKDRSLIAEHIVEATGKGKPQEIFFLCRIFIKIITVILRYQSQL